ncbi:MAG: DNA internalization-related competence protein ComEC/Rec2 [Anaerolineae bacterium]|nr:DNA internalization-related competence protein ComEC/Rec2 [Anaerolineae bacterium]
MELACFAVAWLAGIALAEEIGPPWQVLPVLGLLAFFVLLLWRENPRARLIAACALFLAAGAGRFLLAAPHFDETSLATYNDVGWVTLEGVVVGEPDERETYTNLRVRAERLALPGGALPGTPDGVALDVEGLALVKADRYPERSYGDRVLVDGMLETPPVLEDFSYKDYLARQGIHSMVRRAKVTLLAERQANPLLYMLFRLKRRAQSTIAAILPEPQAALLTGILLGIETGIPADLMDDFAATGTTHIIAISGFNITIVSGIFFATAKRLFGERRAFWIAALGVAIYTILVGASAAVVRAAAMGILYLVAVRLGRATYAPASLAAAAFFMTLLNPYTLWDVGFQLSFAATIGLVLYTDPMVQASERTLARFTSAERAEKIVSLVSEALLVTLAAQITTTPIILNIFGRLSLVTLATNFLILPVQSYLMIAGAIALLLGLVFQPLGQVAGWVVWVFLTYTIEMVRLTARAPFASVPVHMESWMVWAYYALLAGLTWWFKQAKERRAELWYKFTSSIQAKFTLGASAVLLILAFFFWRGLPDGKLHVTFLDVGQGDAIFIQTPSGKQILIDGGPSETQVLAQLGRQMPFWDRTLDVVVLTHPDSDHVNGLVPVLERYRVDVVIHRQIEMDSETYDYWLELVEDEGASVYEGQAGLSLTLDEADAQRPGLEMLILHPGVEVWESANDNSVVTRLVYGQVSLLLTGDIEAEVEGTLVGARDVAPLQSTVLKAAHHGSCSSSTQAFLDAVDPEVVVISVGVDNRFGHPCDEVLERLAGLPLYRTDEHGAVEIVSDGVQVWVETER